MSFPPDFTWGVASAAYQIEGAPTADGKGLSTWDMFTRKPGAIWGGQNADVACDFYHRWRDDLKLMRDLGIKAHRFSIAWPRVMPEGTGTVNQKGLDFYSAIVDQLIEHGIQPWVTLFHWDYPLALYHRGGWLNRESADWFAEYTQVVVDRLSDRVRHWMPQNEPHCYLILGHERGYHAPGDKLRFDELLLATHNNFLAHGRAVQVIRARSKQTATIGCASVGCVHMPATSDPADVEAARIATFRTVGQDLWNGGWFHDPMLKGEYPADGLKTFGDKMPKNFAADMTTIAQPLDFVGLNVYSGIYVKAGPDGQPQPIPLPLGYPKTTFEYWHITPDLLYWGPRYYWERYGRPIVITENGHQNADVISLDGKVHDPQRIDYLHRHLRELRRAAADGVDVRGYMQWCFTDNFEWAVGDAIRVGLVYTDYPTQRRVPKDSAYWYTEVIRTNGKDL